MTLLVWDEPGTRVYENGLDRGVLYLSDGSGIPWNGLTSVVEKSQASKTSLYFDGMKFSDLVVLGAFSAVMKAYTYPSEFERLSGSSELQPGITLEDQPLGTFDLSYRTQVGNDVDGDTGHKIHIVYNLTAVPSDRSRQTMGDSVSLTEFEWDISGIPEEFDGFRPSAHIIIDTRTTDEELVEELEAFLYGTESEDALLPPLTEMLTRIHEWTNLIVVIESDGDGTWTAKTQDDADIEFDLLEPGVFTLYHANATFLNADTYELSSTESLDDL